MGDAPVGAGAGEDDLAGADAVGAAIDSQPQMSTTFVNWVGNQRCSPARRRSPASEAEVEAIVRDAIAAGEGVRVVATGHSLSPVLLTDGTLIDLANLGGIVHIDAAARRVRALPGTAVGAF